MFQHGMFTKSIGLLKMHLENEKGIDFLRVRQLIDYISLFKHAMCLSSIKMSSIRDDKAYYDVEYMVFTPVPKEEYERAELQEPNTNSTRT